MQKILVIVANYNQAPEIANFLKDLSAHWPKKNTVIIDDGSTDHSNAIAKNMDFKVIGHTQNQGIGAAIRTGILYAKAQGFTHVVIMSANGKMQCQEIQRVTAPIQAQMADYVTGSRHIEGGSSPGISFFRKISIPIFSAFSFLILGQRFTDITCGFRCYRIDFLFEAPVDIQQDWLNRYEMEYYIHYQACKKNLRIKEVPVTIKYTHLPTGRRSKIVPFVGWWSMIRPFIFLKLGFKK